MENNSSQSLWQIIGEQLSVKVIVGLVVFVLTVLVLFGGYAVNKGKDIDFMGFKVFSKQEKSRTDDAVLKEVKDKLAHCTLQSEELQTKVLALKGDNIELLAELRQNEDLFLSKILLLESEMKHWDGSINTYIKVEEKKKVFFLLQGLLRRIGYYDGPMDGDALRTSRALIQYKKNRGLEPKYWAYVTHQTIILMVRDYAETLFQESRG